MLQIFDSLRDVTLLSMTVRMLLAVLCGGLIGLEREIKRRPAGFRTHILICLGAAMTTLTGEFLFLNLRYSLDITRMGASVAAGMGFIGAGTIIVTKHERIKGLTTAAGLWTAAIVGLSVGAGFYEGGIIATALILLAEFLLSKLERRLLYRKQEMNLFVEYTDNQCLEKILRTLKEDKATVLNMEITPNADTEMNANALLNIFIENRDAESTIKKIQEIEGVTSLEEF